MSDSLNKSEREELEFYRNFMKSMNAANYVLNMVPYQLTWINDNECVQRVTGLTSEQIMKIGEYIPIRLLESPDFHESVTIPQEKFKENPDIQWAGVYRIKDVDDNFSWVIYSAATLEKNEDGSAKTSTVVGFPVDGIFNTPKTLIAFRDYITKKITEGQRAMLTNKQTEVLKLLAQGSSRKEIADQLQISEYTVDDHKTAIKKKFNCSSTRELVRLAERIALV